MKKTYTLKLLLLLICSFILIAFSGICSPSIGLPFYNFTWQISVRVTSAAGEPLSDVSVILKASSVGATTNNKGEFSIGIHEEKATVVFSSVGYVDQEYLFTSAGTINVTMQDASKSMESVVVIGDGSQKKAEVRTAIASVKAKDVVKRAVNDAVQLLQGKVAGLTIMPPSGDPAANSQILLRRTATISTSTQPLVLVDEIPGSLNTVAPEDIESIDVLKYGSAAAIYGTPTNTVLTGYSYRENTCEGNCIPMLQLVANTITACAIPSTIGTQHKADRTYSTVNFWMSSDGSLHMKGAEDRT